MSSVVTQGEIGFRVRSRTGSINSIAIGTVGTLCLIKTQHSLFVWSAIVTAAKTFTWAGKEHKYVFNMLFLLKGDCYSNYLLIKEVDSARETRIWQPKQMKVNS